MSILKETVLSSVVPLLPASVQPQVINNIDSLVSNTQFDITSLVGTDINSTIDTVSKSLVGTVNPVDIVKSNLSPIQLSNNIESTVISNTLGASIDSFYTKLQALLNSTTTAATKIDFNYIKSQSYDSVSDAITGDVKNSLIENAINLYSPSTEAFNLLTDFSADTFSIDNLDLTFSGYVGSKAFQKAALFDAFNPDNSDKVEKTANGFTDPNGTYPKKEYEGLSDTNKLSQGTINGTVVQKKNLERVTGAKLPNDNSWSQPQSSFNGQYPYNKVIQTESGHVIEMDDTPGSERLHIYHRSGTFIEIDSNGSCVTRTVGSDYKIVDKNGYVSISGKANVSVNGECNIYVGANANVEVAGSAFIKANNDIEINAGGRLKLTAAEAIDMRSPEIYIEADDQCHLNIGNNINVEANQVNVKSGNTMNVQSTNSIDIKSNGILNVQSSSSMNINSGNDIKLQSAGDGHMKFGGTWNADSGGVTMINQGSAANAGTASDAPASLFSQAGLPPERTDFTETLIEDPVTITIADSYAITVETETDDYQELKNRLIIDGITDANELNVVPLVYASDTSSGKNDGNIIQPSNILLGMQSIPDNFQLSEHFTVGMLSSRAAVSKNALVPQNGLRLGEIAANLQALALNVLEPIYNVYPNMFVTSGFRLDQSQTSTSQHTIGQAVDIQFKNVSKQDYYEIAKIIKGLVNCDQLLLEYSSYTNNPWIHISLKSTGNNRNQIMTFWNHRKYDTGLHQLG